MRSIIQRLFKRRAAQPWHQPPASSSAPPATPSTSAADFDSLYAKAAASMEVQDFEQAVELYDQAIALDPSRAEPYYKRANALKNAGRLEAALTSYDQAIERKPDYAYAYCNRGVAQQSLGLCEAALSSYDRAIALDAADARAHYNRALLMQECSRWDDALASYDRAIAISPQFADAQYNRSMAQLFRGDFEAGWQGYEWRWASAQRLGIGELRSYPQPRWLGGQSLAGKRLLLYVEAGLGDTLQFCRYVTLCAHRGAVVILEVQPQLCALLGSLAGVSQVVPLGGTLPPFDHHCALQSLPLAFNTTLDTIPAPHGYLRAEPSRVAQWRMRLGERRRPRIGLAWSGNPNNALDPRRSIRLAEWIHHLPPEFEYFRLQTGVRAPDHEVLDSNPRIVSFDDDSLSFENTAALCECLDLVVSVDTSIAHLAGALGIKTWVMLAHTPDFRWLQDRSDSPWYPSLTLYRQSAPGDWTGVFERVSAGLRGEFH